MQVNAPSPNVNTSRTSNTNKPTHKSSGKIAAAAKGVQNKTEQCPVTSKKAIQPSDVSQMKAMSSQEVPNEVSKDQSISTLTKTHKKTVHNKNIKELKKRIPTDLIKINSKISDIINNKIPTWMIDTKSFSNHITKLTNLIKDYQDKLDSSTYKHHHSKQETLSKLKTSTLETSNNIKLAENKVNLSNQNSEQMRLDNLQRYNDLVNGVKKPSKFDD